MKKLFVLIIFTLLVGCAAPISAITPKVIVVTTTPIPTPASMEVTKNVRSETLNESPPPWIKPRVPFEIIITENRRDEHTPLFNPPIKTAVTDPSWDEMIYFLNHNHVNWNDYVAKGGDRYVCLHFACDVQKAATEQGIRSAFVVIRFPNIGHAIIAFETTDQGLWFFEPQTDLPMKVEIGYEYLDWTYGPGYEASFDDTIMGFTVFWEGYWVCNLIDGETEIK